MTESEQITSEKPETTPRPRHRMLQWSIATLLLLMAAVAVWTTYFHMKSEAARMNVELDLLRQLARELIVNDPAQFAIVERHDEWDGDDVWDVYLPEGNRYFLKLATREIDTQNYPDTEHSVELAAGRHVISLEKKLRGEGASARLIVDEQSVLNVAESSDWNASGSYGWGGSYDRSTQAPCDKPLQLIRIRFHKQLASGGSSTPDEPHHGVLTWIERE